MEDDEGGGGGRGALGWQGWRLGSTRMARVATPWTAVGGRKGFFLIKK